jgi:DNA-nicking Smr family endonuclease
MSGKARGPASPAPPPGGPALVPKTGERLWRAVTRTVKPLAGKPLPSNEPRELLSQTLALPASQAVGQPRPLQPTAPAAPQKPPRVSAPVQDRGPEKRVRRGKLEIGAKLDLHGYTQEKAEAAVLAFLQRAQADGAEVVLIVTGKGGRLQTGEVAPGVLKRRLPDWLDGRAIRPLVAGYAQAHQRHGGGGAFYVWIKRRTPTP